ncbi:MAG: DoxX family membrane protein [Proteobacteria bacterium]|nr:DoxX family membrane protein [Pseudomonadota bacterium]MBU4471133.1 DoxX family membrane protein [Pseudomonadota bacterium]MCG2750256.1 DoxX family membrane protein [Desulfobacteraceae bacterium]
MSKTQQTFYGTLVFHGLRIFLGAVFVYAAYDKILYPLDFAEGVYNYQILPDILVNLVALVLPFLELFMGICLILGFWLPGATVISSGLLMVFISALVFNLFRGLDVQCGCFSTKGTGEGAGFLTVLRDVFFLGISIYLLLKVFIHREKGE